MDERAARTALRKVARENRVSVETVRGEIEQALAAARANPDPQMQELWASIPKKGAIPTVEETIAFIAKQVKTQRQH